MHATEVRYTSFPRTKPPAEFISPLVDVFVSVEEVTADVSTNVR